MMSSDIIKESFEKTRLAGDIASATLDEVEKIIKPGITTKEIDNLLISKNIDLAVHSAKDIPAIIDNRITIAASCSDSFASF